MQNSAYTLGVSMVLRDMFSGPAANIRNNMAMLSKDAYRMRQDMIRSSRDTSLGIAAVGYGATRALGNFINVGAEFGYTMQFVKSITKATQQEFSELDKIAKSLAGRSIFKPGEVASGMQFMAMAGQNALEIQKNIEAATFLAQATTHQLGGKGGAADIVTNVMKGFQINAENSMQVADVLTKAVTSANTNLFDLGEAMKYSMSTASQLNISLEETAAGIMTLGNAGIQASMAGVAMENLLRYYVRASSDFSTGKVNKVMASIGLTKEDILDAEGRMRNIGGFMTRLKGKMQGLGEAEIYNVMRELFGVRGNRAAIQIYQNLDKMVEFTNLLKDGSIGTSQRISAELMDTLAGRTNAMVSAWDALKASFAQSLEPALKPLLMGVTWVVKVFDKIAQTPILGSIVTGAIAGFITLQTALHGINFLIQSMTLLSMRLTRALGGVGIAGTAAFTGMAAAGGRARTAMGAQGILGMVGTNRAGRLYWTQSNPLGRGGTLIGVGTANRLGLRQPGVMAGALGRLMSYIPGLTRVLGFFGRAFAFALGPWGLALTILLPALISGIAALTNWFGKKHEDEKDKAKALNRNIDGPYMKANGVYLFDSVKGGQSIGETPEQNNNQGTSKDNQSNPTIIINVDGVQTMRRTMRDVMDNSDYENGITLVTS